MEHGVQTLLKAAKKHRESDFGHLDAPQISQEGLPNVSTKSRPSHKRKPKHILRGYEVTRYGPRGKLATDYEDPPSSLPSEAFSEDEYSSPSSANSHDMPTAITKVESTDPCLGTKQFKSVTQPRQPKPHLRTHKQEGESHCSTENHSADQSFVSSKISQGLAT